MIDKPVRPGKLSWLLPAGLLAFALLVHFVLFRDRGFYDRYDTDNYYKYGSWITTGGKPYIDIKIPYPQLATYLFALPHLLLGPGSHLDTPRNYKLVFSLLMLGLLWTCITLCQRLLADRKKLAYLFLLPASLFFSHQRYDMVPALFSLLTFYDADRKKYCRAAFWLALGVFSKWYPLLLAPIFLKFHLDREHRFPFRPLAVFMATSLFFVFLTALHSGWEALWSLPAWHLNRGHNKEGLFYQVFWAANYFFDANISNRTGYTIFLILQFAPVPLCFLRPVSDSKQVVRWSCLVILVSMLFARVYSPQWVLWALPWLVLLAENKREIYLIVAFDIATYLYFPIAAKNFGFESAICATLVFMKNFVLILLICLSAKKIVHGDSSTPKAGHP